MLYQGGVIAYILQSGAGITYAAGLARAYNGGVYTDWYLPSKDELNKLYLNKVVIGGFAGGFPDGFYWSSSEDSSTTAWIQYFDGDTQPSDDKNYDLRVRAVRAF